MAKVYLVDGSGYIFRAFFAIAPLSNSKGMPTNALYGFSRMLAKLIREVDARHIAVMFDTGEPTFRHQLYSDYKANREECPAELKPQMPYFRKIVQAFGIQCLEKVGLEADDIIATLARKFSNQGHEVIVVSGDKDLLQLVNDQIKVFDAMREVTFDQKAVEEKFGVLPEQMRDYLALVGDSSDNVPGVKGVGPKSAERLIKHFGSIDGILKKPEEIEALSGLRGAKSIRLSIESAGDKLRLSQKLVSLDEKVEPYFRVSDVEEFAWTEARQDQIEPLFAELEFTKLLDTLQLSGLESRTASGSEKSIYSDKKYTLIKLSDLVDFSAQLKRQSIFAFDTETTALDVLTCELIGISISWKAGEAFFISLIGENSVPLIKLREVLGPIFANPEIKKVGSNLKFDIGVLEEQGIPVNGACFDTMICSHLLHPDRRGHGLKNLAQVYLNERMHTYEEMLAEASSIADVPLDVLTNYACHDADMSWQLSINLKEKLGEDLGPDLPSQYRAFFQVEMPLVPVLSRMERDGIKVDLDFLDCLGQEFVSDLSVLEEQIHTLAGKTFNINSPKQLAAVLFEDLGIPTAGVKKKQSGFSTDASVLEKLSGEYEIAARLLDYRELHKLNSTYVEALKRLVHPKTKRIHTSFNQAVAATGRLSSSDPNLQNIPIRNPRGRRLRQAFVAEPGCSLISADYSQIELRMLAHLSGDPILKQAFVEGEDIHERTAREIFGGGLMSEAEKKDLRRVAKTINFGIIYGMGAFRLSNELNISRKQAQKYIDDYFARYPKVLTYYESLKNKIERNGYVETLFGRRRYLSEVDTSGRDPGYAERSLINAPLQGSAAEVIKIAMIKLSDLFNPYEGKVKMVLQVHDELVFEVEESLLEEIQHLVTKTMENTVSLQVPLRVDSRSGKSWGE